MIPEQDKILLSIEEYGELRISSRTALGRVGIGTNPGFSDHDILQRLSSYLDAPEAEMYDEFHEYAAEFFRDNLAFILEIEFPAQVSQIKLALTNIHL